VSQLWVVKVYVVGLLEDTPIEEYYIGDTPIWVKREDMVCSRRDFPPLSKIRGIATLCYKLKMRGYSVVGVLDTRVSKAGWGAAAVCRDLKMKCIVGIPHVDGEVLPISARKAQELGADIIKLKPSRYSIMYARLRRHVESVGGFTLPLGLACEETVLEVRNIVRNMDPKYFEGSLVVCAGTGTILSGIICGLPRYPQKIISVSSGMATSKQMRTIKRFVAHWAPMKLAYVLRRLEMIPAIRDYYEESPIAVPFPCHPNYDAKAWEWLCSNIHVVPKPILFWNIGA